MLDYEWGNTSTIYFSGEEATQDSGQTRQMYEQYNQNFAGNIYPQTTAFSPHHSFQHQQQEQTHIQTLYDPRAYTLSYAPPAPASLPPESVSNGNGFMIYPKSEDVYGRGIDFQARIGLNLGGRTYFSSSEDDLVSRLYRRTRPFDAGALNSPKCQAQGCNADLTHAKHYHRRHKVCEFHSKASTVLTAGLTQRFCQQCSRFHVLTEFDQGKRSCRKRLADHNRRRRKSQPHQQQTQMENTRNSPSEIPARSSPDSGAHSSSSVTVALSPPRMSLSCFQPKQHQASVSSSSSNSLFSHVNFRPYDRQIQNFSWDEEQ